MSEDAYRCLRVPTGAYWCLLLSENAYWYLRVPIGV